MHRVTVLRDRRGLGFPVAAQLVKGAVKAALKCQGIEDDCLVNVLFTNDNGICEINLAQRGVDAPTDVLSFPMNEMAEGGFDAECCEFDYESECVMLGDVVISLERCGAQAAEFSHSFERELCYLTVHSVLHLLGYDHMDEGAQKKRMRAREKAIMSKMEL